MKAMPPKGSPMHPKVWRRDRLKDVASLRTEKTKDKSDLVDYLELEDIESWSMKILNKRNTLEVESAVTLFNAGDVLFGKLRPYLAKVCRPEFNGKCTGEILAICPTHVDGNFLKYALIDPEMIKKCTEFSYGAKMPRVNWNTQLSTFEISLPPLPEQKRIAAFLDAKCADIDKAIEAKRKQLDCIDEMWKNILYKATTQGLNSARMVKTRNRLFPEIPNGWKIKRLKDVATIFGRIGFRGYTTADIVSEGEGALSLSPSNLKDVYMEYSKRTYISWEKYWESPEIIVNDGDVVMVKTGSSYGKTCLVRDLPCETTLNPQLVVLKDIKCDNRFLAFLLQNRSMQFQVECIVSGGTIPTMSQQKMSDFRFPLPPCSEQCEIANYLDAKRKNLDELKDNLRRQIEVLEQYRKSLIHECVMGERRVG